MNFLSRIAALAGITVCSCVASAQIELNALGTYRSGVYAQSACEIAAFDPVTKQLFVVNAFTDDVDVIDISVPTNPTLMYSIDLSLFGNPNSVAVRDGVVAVAVEAPTKTAPGTVVFLDTAGNMVNMVTVGALPDMLTFSPNGRYVVVANEGEPNSYNQATSVDPEGSVSIIDMAGGVANLNNASVRTAHFQAFNTQPIEPGIRIFGPNATVAQDLEPEYVAISHDSKTAWVTCQENNALAIVDLTSGMVTGLKALGVKDHSLPGQGLDPSDRDNANLIGNWPVRGMYMPDAIDSIRYKGETYLITANEGDARDYTGFAEEARVSTLTLDPTVFPNAAFLKNNARLGRLTVTTATGDTDNDGDLDQINVFGSRSFTVWSANGSLVWDSGDQLEQITKSEYPLFFNASNDNNDRDNRSDNKGPEPEGLVIGKAFGKSYAFIGLERIGGVMVYDVTNPTSPRYVTYANNRDFTKLVTSSEAKDLGPEGVCFIKAEDSPTGDPLLVVANEVSGSVTVYSITKS